ncbi:MAG: glutamine--fructose-6-phosphate aminotransferase, partial [Halomonas sp.]|nr:glutamine--fructose-6-phosphate aminotransferase [Halomonas sp.]
MCGIVGAVSSRNVTPVLLEGLKRLEYRGYDSAGVALVQTGQLQREREVGRVAELEARLATRPVIGRLGIAHTRWATHGKPTRYNAHPHLSNASVAVVHNGIIENHAEQRAFLQGQGYVFHSETDTEVIGHLFHFFYEQTEAKDAAERLLEALRATLARLHGAYALGIVHIEHPDVLLCARMGSPLVIGRGSDEQFIASDPLALLQVTDRFIYLEEGDYGLIGQESLGLYCLAGDGTTPHRVERPLIRFEHGDQVADKGEYRHFML